MTDSMPARAAHGDAGPAHDAAATPAFHTHALTFRYPRAARDAVCDIDLTVRRGEMLALLGPNGSGKSTLLRLLLGALRPASGDASFLGRPVAAWPRDELARRIGVVTQLEEIAFPLTVRELVAMGRYPHLGTWRAERAADRAAVQAALERCGIADLAGRGMDELSGGERQRARLARALAQEADTLVFDEPTASLDIAHEMALFEMLAELRADGATILLVTHDINLAARYADRLALLARGSLVTVGSPAAVIAKDVVESVYGWPVEVIEYQGAPQIVAERRTRD